MKRMPISSRFELRFELERAELYRQMALTRVGTQIFGGMRPQTDPESPTLRAWSVGLLAMCLFDIKRKQYAAWTDAIVYLVRLRSATLTVMLAELADQAELAAIFDRAETKA